MIKCGFAQVDFTPSFAVELGGTFEVRKTDVVDIPVFATAMVLDNGAKRLVWVACDLIFLSDELYLELASQIASKLGVDPDNVFISCTHTHNGPNLFKGVPPVEPPVEVVTAVKKRIIESAVKANIDLQPVVIKRAQSQVNASFNRRVLRNDGKAVTNPGFDDKAQQKEGPEDYDLQSLWFFNQDAEVIGMIVNYSAHPTTMLFESEISSDFPGHMRKKIQQELNQKLPILYLQGACGNTSPIDFSKDSRVCQWKDICFATGQLLAESIIDSRNRTVDLADCMLNIASEVLHIPTRKSGDEDLSEEACREYLNKNPLDKIDKSDTSLMYQWYFADSNLKIQKELQDGVKYPVRVSVLNIGGLLIAANPAELFVEYQLEMKQEIPAPLMVSELTNGHCGYVITERALKNGSYEAKRADSSKLPPYAGKLIKEATVRLAKVVLQ